MLTSYLKFIVAFKIHKTPLLTTLVVLKITIYLFIFLYRHCFTLFYFLKFSHYSEWSFKSFTRTSDWLSHMIILFSSPKIFSLGTYFL